MRMNEMIVCPKCRTEIPLTEALAHRLREELSGEFKARHDLERRALEEREKALLEKSAALERSRRELEAQLAARLAQEKPALLTQARAQAGQEVSAELQDLRAALVEKGQKLSEAQAAELDLRKEKRKLEAATQALELEVARKLDEERAAIAAQARQTALEEQQLRVREKEKLISDLQQQILLLQQKAEQGSQQLQGEVLELEIEAVLRQAFPHDQIDPVNHGARGADLLQTVRTAQGQLCGTIIWETKRTRRWSDDWIGKLKADQRENSAEIAALVTQAMPPDCEQFACRENVWVSDFRCYLPMAQALRQGLLSVASARSAEAGRKEKAQVLYDFLATPAFRQHLEFIVAAFVEMQASLEAEKRAMQRTWAKREKQLAQVLEGTSTLYGSLQGIIGSSTLPDIELLSLPAATVGAS